MYTCKNKEMSACVIRKRYWYSRNRQTLRQEATRLQRFLSLFEGSIQQCEKKLEVPQNNRNNPFSLLSSCVFHRAGCLLLFLSSRSATHNVQSICMTWPPTKPPSSLFDCVISRSSHGAASHSLEHPRSRKNNTTNDGQPCGPPHYSRQEAANVGLSLQNRNEGGSGRPACHCV